MATVEEAHRQQGRQQEQELDLEEEEEAGEEEREEAGEQHTTAALEAGEVVEAVGEAILVAISQGRTSMKPQCQPQLKRMTPRARQALQRPPPRRRRIRASR